MRKLALILLVACRSSSPPAEPPPSSPPQPAPPAAQLDAAPAPVVPDAAEIDAAAPAAAAPGMGETCGPSDRCADGLSCVKYYGIAGARGPEFKTCERRCGKQGTCPSGTRCVTIADGPGQVCRP